jgi:hypothetical protein
MKSTRQVDQNHILFLEPANMNTVKLQTRTNIVWSPHFYPLSFASKYYAQNFTFLENDLAAKYETFVVDSGIPMRVGEFGAFALQNELRNLTQDALTLFNRYHVGWAWWAFSDAPYRMSYVSGSLSVIARIHIDE